MRFKMTKKYIFKYSIEQGNKGITHGRGFCGLFSSYVNCNREFKSRGNRQEKNAFNTFG